MKHLVMFLLIGTQLGAWADTFNVISMTNLWKYRQDGGAPGASWREAGYDDSSWSNGRALLYVETSPLPAPKNTPLSLTNTSGQRVVTYYFRTTFTLSNVTDVTLIFSNVLDDGAVFHLNGVEVLRVGMRSGAVSNWTLAGRRVDNAVIENPHFITPTNLLVGTNVLAVEVHQVTTDSTDVVFGTSVGATTNGLQALSVTPLATTVAVGQDASFAASATGTEPISLEWRHGRTAPGLDDVFAGFDSFYFETGAGLSPLLISSNWLPVASLTPEIQISNTVAAVRSYGQGKVAIFGHSLFLDDGRNKRLWTNLFHWCDAAGKRVLASSYGHGEYSAPGLRATFASLGFATNVILPPLTPAKLSNVSVLVVNATGFESGFTTNEIEAVRQFVQAGGSLWAGGQGWVWHNYNPAFGLTNWPMSKLVAPYDVQWTLGYFETGGSLYNVHPLIYSPLPGQTNAVLDLFNVNTNDAGRYTVVARNPYGERQASALLTVLRSAAITVGPVSLTAGPGGTALLSVQATGDELRYQWNFNGVPVDGQTNATLLITSLDAAGVGSYTVTVYNQVSTVTSEPALVALFGLDMVPGLTLVGPVGAAFRIDFSEALEGGTNWHSLTNVVLPAPVYRVTDWEAVGKPSRFYRAVLLP